MFIKIALSSYRFITSKVTTAINCCLFRWSRHQALASIYHLMKKVLPGKIKHFWSKEIKLSTITYKKYLHKISVVDLPNPSLHHYGDWSSQRTRPAPFVNTQQWIRLEHRFCIPVEWQQKIVVCWKWSLWFSFHFLSVTCPLQ